MAKKKYLTIGSVIKGREGKPDYIKLNSDIVVDIMGKKIPLKKGQFLNLKSKRERLYRLDRLEESGKLSGEMLEKLRERALAIPDFVRFEVEIVVEE